MRRMSTAVATALAVAALAAGGCGDDEDEEAGRGQSSEPAGGGQTIRLSADPGGALEFDKDTLSAEAGTVTIELQNPSSLPHAIEVEGNGIEEEGETVEKGGTSTVSVDLEPGTYEYYCPVGNHQQGGMTGELTVQ